MIDLESICLIFVLLVWGLIFLFMICALILSRRCEEMEERENDKINNNRL